jgi:ABC-type phosphate/phosphonate transport system ATPase subunit
MTGQTAASDPALGVAQACGAIGDLEHVAAAQIRAGKLSGAQKARIFTAQDVARPLCSNPSAAAADPQSLEQLRALVPVISAALAKD